MEQILTQSEVDALLSAVSDGTIDTESGDVSEEIGVISYDLTSQDRIIRGKMPTLDIIHDKFTKQFSSSLSTLLRRIVTISVLHTELVKFGELIRTLPLPTCLNILRLHPLRGNSLLVLESRIVFTLVDTFFGGSLSSGYKVEGRDFTPIELRLVKRFVKGFNEELEKAWASVYPIQVDYVRTEINPQFAAVVSQNDIVIEVIFELELETITGRMILVMPYSTFSPIKDKLVTSFQGEKLEIDELWVKHFRRQIERVNVECSVELGSTQILIQELLDLEEGDVIPLDNDVDEGVIMRVEGVPKYRAEAGHKKGNHAVKLKRTISADEQEVIG